MALSVVNIGEASTVAAGLGNAGAVVDVDPTFCLSRVGRLAKSPVVTSSSSVVYTSSSVVAGAADAVVEVEGGIEKEDDVGAELCSVVGIVGGEEVLKGRGSAVVSGALSVVSNSRSSSLEHLL